MREQYLNAMGIDVWVKRVPAIHCAYHAGTSLKGKITVLATGTHDNPAALPLLRAIATAINIDSVEKEAVLKPAYFEASEQHLCLLLGSELHDVASSHGFLNETNKPCILVGPSLDEMLNDHTQKARLWQMIKSKATKE